MPGFLISNLKNKAHFSEYDKDGCINECIILDSGISIERHTLKKFENDKLFYESEKYIIVTEGVLLNSKELLNKNTSIVEFIISNYRNGNLTFFSDFIGPYSGVLFDKETFDVVAWTNQTGESTVFCYNSSNNFVIGSQLDFVVETLKANEINYQLDDDAVTSMLTYGFMYDEMTFIKEIKRLFPGTFIHISNGDVTYKEYWRLTGKEYNLSDWSEQEIIDEMDKRFRNAVYLEFDKDREYGYKHLVDISGGFDARMVCWVAKDLGFSDMVNIHYSQSYSDEEIISREIANKLGNPILLRPLDDISFIYDVEKIVRLGYGLSLCTGITGGESLLSYIECSSFGIEHTGMIGDVVIGSFLDSSKELDKKEISGLFSTRLQSKLTTEHLNRYPNFEIQKIYIRGLLGACSSFMIRRHYIEGFAPFLNPDFLSFCMSIPIEYRAKHKLYNKWVIQKYPGAADIKWTYTDAKITENSAWVFIKKLFKKGSALLLDKLKIRTYRAGMNPFNYWYSIYPKYREFYDTYFRANINNKVLTDEQKENIKFLYEKGGAREKGQAITVLSTLKLYFPEMNDE